MLARLLAVDAFAVLSLASTELPSSTATGMLEYLSQTALVVRLQDSREIQIRIPQTMPVLADQETGDWVDVSFRRATPTLDKGLNFLLYVELTDIHPFRKPSALELESAEASPIAKLSGNLLPGSNSEAGSDEQPTTPGPFYSIRRKVEEYLSRIPNYAADEVTLRFTGVDTPPQWTQTDQIQDEVRLDRRHEIRIKISLNGKPWNAPYETLPGMKWRAAYTARLRAVFSHPDKVTFFEESPGRFNGHLVWVYPFRAPADSISHWVIGEQAFWPATEGKAWISVQDGKVLQLETSSTGFPPDFPISVANERILFDYVQIGFDREVLSVTSESVLVRHDSGKTFLNRNTYTNYRRFEATPLVASNSN